jgi:hypothetical protein
VRKADRLSSTIMLSRDVGYIFWFLLEILCVRGGDLTVW